MSNVVALRRPLVPDQPALAGLIDLFARRRRTRHDAFWLKENAELVQCLAALGLRPDATALEPLHQRAGDLLAEVRFFPQYYRMYLSLALDLRALGVTQAPVEPIAAFVQAQGLIAGEMSDTHRGEALALLRRAGAPAARDGALEDRLWAFASRAGGFCLPNRRAAYDLTHIVFHAADYGRAALPAGDALRPSLMNAGIIAWLEGNLDLLAEVTLALRLSGQAVPAVWQAEVAQAAGQVRFVPAAEAGSLQDDYHQYLVLNWAQAASGGPAFATPVPATARLIRQPAPVQAALRELSLALLDLGASRRADWGAMRWRVWGKLSAASRARLALVEPLPEFEGFFAGFARAWPDPAPGAVMGGLA